MVVEDLQHIIPDMSKPPSRRIYLMMGAVVGALALTTIVMAIALGVLYAKNGAWREGVVSTLEGQASALTDGKGGKVCLTPGCLHSASWMLDNIDRSVNPCDDFYAFSCGGWMKKTDIPPTENDISVMEQLHDTKDTVEREILTTKIARNTERSYERKMKTLFSMCMNEYQRMSEGGATLMQYVNQYLGSWYASDPQNWSSSWDMQSALAAMHVEFMSPVLFIYFVEPDPTQFGVSGRNIIVLKASGSDYQHSPLLEGQPGFTDYQEYIQTVGTLLLRDSNIDLTPEEVDSRITQFVNDVIAQEAAITEITYGNDEEFAWSAGGSFITINELSQNYTMINWLSVLSAVFSDVEIDGSTEVLVEEPARLLAIDRMLREESTEADRMMNNYMVWSVARDFSEFLSWEYRQARYKYKEALSGRKRTYTTWHQCVHVLRSHMSHAVAASFFRKHVGAERKYQVQLMTAELKQGLSESVDELNWMDDETKLLAKRKIDSMGQIIGYPGMLDDDEYLDNMYDKLLVNDTLGFVETLILSGEYAQSYLSAQLLGGIDLNMWDQSLQSHDFGLWIHYLWGSNRIFVPGGLFRFPYFTEKSPYYLNYGALGTRAAGQMAISVDEMGKNMYNGTYGLWWSDDTLINYQREKLCYVNYFSNITAGPYTVDGEQRTVPVNGMRRVWAILLRAAALKVGYKAYNKWQSMNGTESVLPALGLSQQQLFFLSATQTRCSKYDEKTLFRWVSNGYVPQDILMNGVLSHMKEFSEAFSCPSGSKMRADTRCSLF